MFKSVEESLELFLAGETSDTGFSYVYNCEEVDFGDGEQDFDPTKNYFEQLNEIRHYGDIQVVQDNTTEPYDEFTRVICPAYKA